MPTKEAPSRDACPAGGKRTDAPAYDEVIRGNPASCGTCVTVGLSSQRTHFCPKGQRLLRLTLTFLILLVTVAPREPLTTHQYVTRSTEGTTSTARGPLPPQFEMSVRVSQSLCGLRSATCGRPLFAARGSEERAALLLPKPPALVMVRIGVRARARARVRVRVRAHHASGCERIGLRRRIGGCRSRCERVGLGPR